MIELNEQQQWELDQPEPVAIDPRTSRTYILVPSEVYQRVKSLLGDEGDWEQAYSAAMEVFAREGWNDPRMDVYDALDPRRRSS